MTHAHRPQPARPGPAMTPEQRADMVRLYRFWAEPAADRIEEDGRTIAALEAKVAELSKRPTWDQVAELAEAAVIGASADEEGTAAIRAIRDRAEDQRENV